MSWQIGWYDEDVEDAVKWKVEVFKGNVIWEHGEVEGSCVDTFEVEGECTLIGVTRAFLEFRRRLRRKHPNRRCEPAAAAVMEDSQQEFLDSERGTVYMKVTGHREPITLRVSNVK